MRKRLAILVVLGWFSGSGVSTGQPFERFDSNVGKGVVLEARDGTDQGKSMAILIGVQNYTSLQELKYCNADVELLAKVLREHCDFDRVFVMTDAAKERRYLPTEGNIYRELRQQLSIANAGGYRRVLLYFSGHGVRDAKNQLYFAPLDCDPKNVGLTAVPQLHVRQKLDACTRVPVKILILDCCHAGEGKGDGVSADAEDMLEIFRRAKGLFTIASCGADEVSLEWDEKGHGLFTYWLCEGLKGGTADRRGDGNGRTDLDELHRFLYANVLAVAADEMGRDQTVRLKRSDDAEGIPSLPKARIAQSVREPKPLVRPVAAGITDGQVLRDFNVAATLQNNGVYSRAAERWTAFISKFPNDTRLNRVHYYLGVCLLHEKKPAEAAEAFETVLSSWPNFEQADGARFNLGMAYYQVAEATNRPDDYDKAADALGKVSQQSPHAFKALYFQGESYYMVGDLPQAIEAYSKLVSNFATCSLLGDALYAMGTAQQELQQVTDAKATFTRFLSRPSLQDHELATEVRLRLGMLLYDLDKFTEAEPQFKAAAEEQGFPHADFALLRQAQCLVQNDEIERAAVRFVKLTKEYPNSSYLTRAELGAGKCYFLINKLDDARRLLEPIMGSGGEEEAEAAYWLGRTLLEQNRPSEAIGVLEKAVAQFEQNEFGPYLAIALIDAVYESPEHRGETARLCREFIEQHPDHPLQPRAKYMAALAALGKQDYKSARELAEAFLDDRRNSFHELRPAVLFIAAEANLLPHETGEAGGDGYKAEQFYRELVGKYPDHERAARSYLRIGRCLHDRQKYFFAASYLRGALTRLTQPEHIAEANLIIGSSCAAEEKHHEALDAYKAALTEAPDWSRIDEVLIGAAHSLRALGQVDAARERLLRITDSFPDSEFAEQAAHELRELAPEEEE